jgi:hypothetical protein
MATTTKKISEMSPTEFWEYINGLCYDHQGDAKFPIPRKYCNECLKKIDGEFVHS